MKKKYFTFSPSQTEALGKKMAREILKTSPGKRAVIIGLEGDLGGGKTTFLKGFAKGLGIKKKILSPTFIILKKFKVQSSKFKVFYHIDCYRIEKPKEILDLGFKEIIADQKNIVSVEWADRIRKILPKRKILIKFEFLNKKTRRIFSNFDMLK
ncbi:tRNA (adenosine(37)-N6)-threonylcarbamoyltransferase complex ATPase subunit type 1 TsaE [Patescibacteria group bacterium]|nr:tRNA (adenosine(37)-N6)-threonylcarbamoyltransferase complex ATPase subunit type 1 TsaE [Patescibacteria group bacterium]